MFNPVRFVAKHSNQTFMNTVIHKHYHIQTVVLLTADDYFEAFSTEGHGLYVSSLYVTEEVPFSLDINGQANHIVHQCCILNRPARCIRMREQVGCVNARHLRVGQERIIVCQRGSNGAVKRTAPLHGMYTNLH